MRVLQSGIGSEFNTNVMKIALNFKEDKVAAALLANYPV
jgi:hypothetical protein